MQPGDFLRNQFGLYDLWILERALPLQPDAVLDPPEATEIRFVDRHERRDWVCERASDRDWPQFHTALQHDHDLVLASREGVTIGWAWVGYERVFLPALGRGIQLPLGTAYLYEAFVRPGERGRGVGRGLVAARCRQASVRGARRALSHVLTGNPASLRTLQAHGFEIVGRTHFLKALLLRLWTRAPLPAEHQA